LWPEAHLSCTCTEEGRKIYDAAAAMGKRGRAVNSEDQKEASRENGKKGGRPKKEKPEDEK